MKRIVVFGGTGFIGSKLCLYLADKGFKVICLGRTKPSVLDHRIEFHKIDFHVSSTWNDLLLENDYVFNLIALHVAKEASLVTEESHFAAINDLAVECLAKKVRGLLYLSSGGAIYGNGNIAFSEMDMPNPISHYGIIKYKVENIFKKYQEEYQLPLSIVRPSNIYGESQNLITSFGVVTNFYNRIANNLTIEIYGDLSICKDYLHVDDLVPELSHICLEGKLGIFNLGFGKSYTLKEIIQKIEAQLSKVASCKFHPLKENDVHSYSLDCTKARVELGFNPLVDLDEGINRYYQAEHLKYKD